MAPRNHRSQTLSRVLLSGLFVSLGFAVAGLAWTKGTSDWTPEKARELNSVWTALHRSSERPFTAPITAPAHATSDDAIRLRYKKLRAELEEVKAQGSQSMSWLTRWGLVAAILFGTGYLATRSAA